MLPQATPGSTKEEYQAAMEKNMGKPWATVIYHKANEASMGMNTLRAFAVDLVAVFLLVWLLLKSPRTLIRPCPLCGRWAALAISPFRI